MSEVRGGGRLEIKEGRIMRPEELEHLLGLAPGESLLRGPEQSLPRDERARGYAAERLEDIASRLESEGDVQDVLEGQCCIVQHLQWALGAYFVSPANEAQRLDVVSGVSLELGDGDLLLGGRDRPVVLRVLAPGESDKVYVLEHGRAELWSVARSEPPTDLQLHVPGLGDLTEGVAGDPSIEAEFEQLRTSGDALDRLAATGLLLRFWIPGDRDARNRWLHALAMGESPLLIAAKRWYSSLSNETRLAASEVAEAELGRLRDTLLRLGSATAAGESKPLATRLALGRDRLESVRRLMATAGSGEALTRAVHAFDDLAATHLTQLSDADVSDERLRRVFVSEPEAWWGAVAR
jgi:hypothetical protein